MSTTHTDRTVYGAVQPLLVTTGEDQDAHDRLKRFLRRRKSIAALKNKLLLERLQDLVVIRYAEAIGKSHGLTRARYLRATSALKDQPAARTRDLASDTRNPTDDRALRFTRHMRLQTKAESDAAMTDAARLRREYMSAVRKRVDKKYGTAAFRWTAGQRDAINAMLSLITKQMLVGTMLREELAGRVQALERAANTLRSNNKALAAQVRELEHRGVTREHRDPGAGGVTYKGVWRAGEEYPAGTFITCKGSLWHANIETSARPGTDGSGWQLAVKRGRDAHRGSGRHDDNE